MKMTREEALDYLRSGGDWPRLVEAMARVASAPESTLDEIMLGLKYPGLVQEHAAIALHVRTKRPRPPGQFELVTDPADWANYIHAHATPAKSAT
jgi:hypothetical protein